MSNARVCFIAYITVESDQIDQATAFFGERLARQFGGATIAPAAGFWATDGDEVKARYDGDVLKEQALAIHLSVLPPQKDRALQCLRDTGKEARKTLNLKASAFHIEAWTTEAFHTDISIK
ncbi:hypothetical protein [Kordiimonas sp.]|uniref:hypothetical protein n=1 Tax=Kordiimonas sp. TaxID=1970157 RepID=UPI003A918CAC